MPDAIVWLVMLLPVAAASGWWARARSEAQNRRTPREDSRVHRDYLRGIRYLVNDDADRAIETFTRVLAVDDDTAETHLALGNLFRRQGDIDRALRIHQNLIARPTLTDAHRNQARFELAQDYLRAGVLDRAEDLFDALAEDSTHADRSLTGLLTIHEQTREWTAAVAVARRLEKHRGQSLAEVIAQYHCEQALEYATAGDDASARAALRAATLASRDCVRASLIEGAWRAQGGDHALAIRAYRRVISQNRDFAAEIVAPVVASYEATGDSAGLLRFLDRLLGRVSLPVAHVAKAKALEAAGRGDEAIAHLSRFLQVEASWRAFHYLLELSAADSRTRLTGPLDTLRLSLARLIENAHTHSCSHCGFSSRYLHWQCPSCRQWNRMTPIRDVRPDI